jgi:cation-transporting ATPase 13A1
MQGATEIIPVESMTLPDGREILYVTFQRQRFELNEATNTLEELDCSIDKPIGEYAKAQGIGSTKEVDEIRARYGNNDLNIPLPKLQDVFSKQMLGPIPVFQILCTGLWLMDEYWNYALFNIFSICMFEGSTAFGRLKNMSTLRGLKNKANNVMVRTLL